MLRDAEAEALIQKWSLDVKDFKNSRKGPSGRLDSPQFDNSKIKGRLIVQVSKPLVMPAEMGSSVIDILHRLASPGAERLAMQAKAMMPLEKITGKTIQQIALESRYGLN